MSRMRLLIVSGRTLPARPMIRLGVRNRLADLLARG